MKVYCLMGPTAVGKSSLAMAVAERAPIEIISVDSAMVYRGMNIGTAKPTLADQAKVPHHLIDIREVHECYSVGDFCAEVAAVIDGVIARGNTPLLVGGTMMYFHGLQQGLAQLPATDSETRVAIAQQAEHLGWPAMHKILQGCDLASASRIHPNDAQRIGRALEVYRISGVPLSEQQERRKVGDYQFVNIAMMPDDRSLLHARIADRVHAMLDDGFAQEVTLLWSKQALTESSPAMRSVGYRQWISHLNRQLSREQAIDAMIVATRRLAKRQITWLRGWPNMHVVSMDQQQGLDKLMQYIAL